MQYQIDNCASLYLGLTKWGKVPAEVLKYYQADSRRIMAVDFDSEGWSEQFKKVVNENKAKLPDSSGHEQ